VAKLRAVIFDYYETIAELPFAPRERMFDELAARVGKTLDTGEAFRHWRELTSKDTALRLAGQERPPLDGTPPVFVSFKEVWLHRSGELFKHWGVEVSPEVGYIAYRDAHATARPYPEAEEALAQLAQVYKLAVLSDADDEFLLPNLEAHDLVFEAVVTSEALRAYKPHVSLFREACERLGVRPAAAAYVGDSPWADMAGARNAGLVSVWINRHGAAWPDDIERPDAEIRGLDQLAGVLGGP
jgi:putative hydrolase of the HAD superfamily